MSDQVAAPFTPVPITDPYDYVDLVHHHDGTITRKKPSNHPTVPTVPDLSYPAPVLSKDIPINQSNNTWARIYIPRHALESNSTNDLLPLIVYYPGGGFVISTTATPTCYNFCSKLALQLSVVVVSIDYRVGPEHLLPAAYDDAVEALNWIKLAEDSWLRDHANLSNCFIMGSSAGGNIAYHVGLRVAMEDVDSFKPLKINGLILHYPFFGGHERTESELRMANDLIVPLIVSDVMWKYSLPAGANRDHEYSNHAVVDRSKLFYKIKMLGWKILMSTGDKDPGIDRQIGLLTKMKEKGVKAKGRIVEGDYHGEDILNNSHKLDSLLLALKDFIFSTFSENQLVFSRCRVNTRSQQPLVDLDPEIERIVRAWRQRNMAEDPPHDRAIQVAGGARNEEGNALVPMMNRYIPQNIAQSSCIIYQPTLI